MHDFKGKESGEEVVKKILLVDDNIDLASSLSLLLERLGYGVEVAYDGPGALDVLKTYDPELIILDIGLPGMDGYGVARNIRSAPGGDAYTIVALSGYGQSADKRQAKEAGFDFHLTKPVGVAELQGILHSENKK